MSIRRKIRRARDRELITPGRDLRWYLYRAGRADGRRNIPDLGNPGWETPLIDEMKNEAQNGVGLFGEELFNLLTPYNAAVARAELQLKLAHHALVEAQQKSEQRQQAADAVAGQSATKSADEPAQRRRQARAAVGSCRSAEGARDAAESALATAKSTRQDLADAHRQRTWAFINFVYAACSIYWEWNLRSRRRSAAKLPEHVAYPALELPVWLTDPNFFE